MNPIDSSFILEIRRRIKTGQQVSNEELVEAKTILEKSKQELPFLARIGCSIILWWLTLTRK